MQKAAIPLRSGSFLVPTVEVSQVHVNLECLNRIQTKPAEKLERWGLTKRTEILLFANWNTRNKTQEQTRHLRQRVTSSAVEY